MTMRALSQLKQCRAETLRPCSTTAHSMAAKSPAPSPPLRHGAPGGSSATRSPLLHDKVATFAAAKRQEAPKERNRRRYTT